MRSLIKQLYSKTGKKRNKPAKSWKQCLAWQSIILNIGQVDKTLIIIKLMSSFQYILLLCAIFTPALTQTTQQQSQAAPSHFAQENKTLISLLILLILLAIAVYIDKRNGLRYVTILRLKAGQLIQKLRRLRQRTSTKKEKLAGEENIPSSKDMHTNIFDSQKTYVDADIQSIQQTIINQKKAQEMLSSLQFQEDTPKVNLKEVFQQREGQKSNRSKSKLRSKVQIKKSEIMNEIKSNKSQEFTDDNSFEVNNTEE